MAVTGLHGRWFSGSGNGYTTVDMNFPPKPAYAFAVLHGTTGGGTSYAGIMGFRRRLSDGSDQRVDFGDWSFWPPSVSDFMSSITLAIATTGGQTAWLYALIMDWA
ncbi:hypothetical protein GCM10010218_49310 [Streptomyces mashuensis]|uniref:Uncharacterized protein n=1 Tax=Streptomyces mashuensis TaxID=33904 RepID=A0A919B6T8_9ACTN|nr:hypothetical protein [Streptomyces mashuensis]GHF61853.1 hypothetical protein GCM10010218_49310 [Streptomyces mashuensis]